jgi:hypothetical protein
MADASIKQLDGGGFMREVREIAKATGMRFPLPGMEAMAGPGNALALHRFLDEAIKERRRLFLTINEAAEISRTTTSNIRHHMESGKLRTYQFGGRVLISLASFVEMFGDWDGVEASAPSDPALPEEDPNA